MLLHTGLYETNVTSQALRPPYPPTFRIVGVRQALLFVLDCMPYPETGGVDKELWLCVIPLSLRACQ